MVVLAYLSSYSPSLHHRPVRPCHSRLPRQLLRCARICLLSIRTVHWMQKNNRPARFLRPAVVVPPLLIFAGSTLGSASVSIADGCCIRDDLLLEPVVALMVVGGQRYRPVV